MGRTGNVQNDTQLNGSFSYRTKLQSCLQLQTVKERLYGYDGAGRIETQNSKKASPYRFKDPVWGSFLSEIII